MRLVGALTRILESWSKELGKATQERFLALTVQNLIHGIADGGDHDFMAELSDEARMQLACAIALIGHRPPDDRRV